MRQMVKSSSAGHFSIGGGKGTPRKSRGNANSAASTPAKGKRKSDPVPAIKAEPDAGNSDAGDTEVDELIANTPSKVKPPPQSQTGVKRRRIKESSDSEVTLADLDAIDETPSKRVRTPAPLPKDMVVYQGQSESESNVYESSMSEFVPEDSVGQNEDDKDIDDKVDVTGWAWVQSRDAYMYTRTYVCDSKYCQVALLRWRDWKKEIRIGIMSMERLERRIS